MFIVIPVQQMEPFWIKLRELVTEHKRQSDDLNRIANALERIATAMETPATPSREEDSDK